MGRDAAPAGVVRSCTPGRTPEQPRRLLSGRPGPGTVKRESGKMSRGAPTGAVFFFLPRLLGAPIPSFEGREKRRANPKPDQSRGQHSVGYAVFLSQILITALFIQAPLEFSAFPTVLLIATMLRAVALRGSALRASRLRVTVNVQRSSPHQLLACERKTA